MRRRLLLFCLVLWLPVGAEPVVVASKAVFPRVEVRAQAGQWEKRAAEDLDHYISMMVGGRGAGVGATIVVGEAALQRSPELQQMLERVEKKNPRIRCDAIALLREADTIFLAGSNDQSHYYAAIELLNRFGCRWYMPGAFGECIPEHQSLSLDELEYAYASPFEVRTYWVSWMGDRAGYEEFAHRNFYNLVRPGGGGSHALDRYLKDLPEGTALTDPSTALLVAEKLRAKYAKGEPLSLGISDAIQRGRAAQDLEISGRLQDKYFLTTAWTDVVATFYNQVCRQLKEWEPESRSEIAFLAYTNVTLPPQRVEKLVEPLICYLAPIDIDPNHAMDDPRSPARLDYRGAVEGWSRVMDGRVIIYDYDQAMLVWRPIPNPSHQVVEREVKIYRDIGILGFSTESRHAFSTTFLNLHFRGQLYWNPDYSVRAGLEEFYPKFYGPDAEVFKDYWGEIYRAWETTRVTEHEHLALSAIYTPELVSRLAQIVKPLQATNERVRFTLLGFDFLNSYTQMWQAAASDGDYSRAIEFGRRASEARDALLEMSAQFDTPAARIKVRGPAWLPGEIEQYEQLAALSRKRMTPLFWKFRADPHDHGLWRNWARPGAQADWAEVRTDLYLQAQQEWTESPGGFAWYAVEVEVPRGVDRLMFPGLFNQAWLYLDGQLLAHREQKPLWWTNDYKFEWAVELSGISPGRHTFVLRIPVTEHFAGLFRRPFFYRAGSD